MLSETILTVVLVGTIAVGTSAALLAWRERPEPGATPLVAMLAGESWWSAFLLFELQATTFEMKLIWSNAQWAGVVVIPVAWLLFSLEYTGRDKYVRPRYVALLSVVPAVTLILVVTGSYHDLLYVGSGLMEESGMRVLHRIGGPWYWVITGYTYLLGLLGALPLLSLVTSDALTFRGQSIALLVGTIVPWTGNLLFQAGVIPIVGLDPTPVFFTVSGVAYLAAITRFRLLGTSPTPNRRARHLVFGRMEEPAVVVDSHDYVVDLNDSAQTVLGLERTAALGRPASEVVPEYERLRTAGSPSGPVTVTDGGNERRYDVAITAIDDLHSRTIGQVITFHDVTVQLRQQRRLEVLNRALRHNVRTETSVIYGHADAISDADEDKVEVIKDHAMDVADIAEKARDIIDVFERDRESAVPVSLDLVLQEGVDSVAADYPEATVEYDPVPDDIRIASVLESVIANVIENAVEHNPADDPHVWIDVDRDGNDDEVTVSVSDDGPGINDHELDVLEHREETDLHHGTGLGLWLITWGTEIAGGQVTFEENDPTGTVVRLSIPILSE